MTVTRQREILEQLEKLARETVNKATEPHGAANIDAGEGVRQLAALLSEIVREVGPSEHAAAVEDARVKP